MTKEELKKSVEEIVETILSEKEGESVEKACSSEKMAKNEKKDAMKSKSSDKEEKDMKKKDKKEEAMKMEDKKMEKGDLEKKQGVPEGADAATHERCVRDLKKKGHSKASAYAICNAAGAGMKKAESQEEVKNEEIIEKAEKSAQESKKEDQGIGQLSAEETELVKAWRAQKEEAVEEKISKSQENDEKVEEIKKAAIEQTESLQKALTEQSEIIKSLTDKVEKMASQPAYDKRSLDRLEPIEKGGNEPTKLSKSQISNRMLELQMAGKDVTSKDIAEFEATNNVSNPAIKKLVMDSFKN